MEPLFIKKLKDVIREQVSNNNPVLIDGIGQFYKVHQKQTQKKYDDGRVVLLPPRDIIKFESELKQQNEDQ